MASYRSGGISRSELESILHFKGIEPSCLLDLLADCPVLCLAPDEALITQGTANRNCYFILAGSLRIHLDSLESPVLSTLGIGESVGEISLLDGQTASAHVLCHEECQVLVVPEEVFWSLVNFFHGFCRQLLLLMTGRLRHSNSSISNSLKKQEQYKLIATIDELTGLYNRRWLRSILERQMTRSLFSNTPLALLVIDVDHFKQVNDTFGHNVGDLVLQGVARLMMNSVRPTDLVTRYGGEEFLIVLPGSDLAGARIVAERVRGGIAAATMVAPEVMDLPGVTVSIGAAEMREEEAMDDFIGRADAALYQAKHNGRNRVEG